MERKIDEIKKLNIVDEIWINDGFIFNIKTYLSNISNTNEEKPLSKPYINRFNDLYSKLMVKPDRHIHVKVDGNMVTGIKYNGDILFREIVTEQFCHEKGIYVYGVCLAIKYLKENNFQSTPILLEEYIDKYLFSNRYVTFQQSSNMRTWLLNNKSYIRTTYSLINLK